MIKGRAAVFVSGAIVAIAAAVGAATSARAVDTADRPPRLVFDGRRADVWLIGGPAVPDSRAAGLDAADGRVVMLPYLPGPTGDAPVVDVARAEAWPAAGRWGLGLDAFAVRTDGRQIVVAGRRPTGAGGDDRPATIGVYALGDDGAVRGVGAVDIDGWPTKLERSAARAYTLENEHDLRVVDLTDPARPRASGRWNIGAFPKEIAAGPGSAAYLLFDDHVGVVDATDMDHPRLAGALYGLERARGLAVSPDGRWLWVLDEHWRRAFVADGILRPFDLADPLRPLAAAPVTLPGLRDMSDGVIADFGPILVDADARWLALAADGVAVFDVADPARPVLALRAALPHRAVGLAVDGDRLYVAEMARAIDEPVGVAAFRLSDGSEWAPSMAARAWLPLAMREAR